MPLHALLEYVACLRFGLLNHPRRLRLHRLNLPVMSLAYAHSLRGTWLRRGVKGKTHAETELGVRVIDATCVWSVPHLLRVNQKLTKHYGWLSISPSFFPRQWRVRRTPHISLTLDEQQRIMHRDARRNLDGRIYGATAISPRTSARMMSSGIGGSGADRRSRGHTAARRRIDASRRRLAVRPALKHPPGDRVRPNLRLALMPPGGASHG